MESEQIRLEQIKKEILQKAKTIAVVGISDVPWKASYRVSKYLQDNDYRIIPVNPRLQSVLGETAYPDLKSVPFPVDIVDVFRKKEDLPDIINEALALGLGTIWLQLGLTLPDGMGYAKKGPTVLIEDCCLKIAHNRLLGSAAPGIP